MSQVKAMTLDRLAEMVTTGQVSAKERWDELRADFQQKHDENRERRHQLGADIGNLRNELHLLQARVVILERDMLTVVGDNTGGSGLLHNIDKKVDALQNEVSGMKRVYLFLGFLIPIIVTIILALIFKH
jgi:hypothetical protein